MSYWRARGDRLLWYMLTRWLLPMFVLSLLIWWGLGNSGAFWGFLGALPIVGIVIWRAERSEWKEMNR